MTDTVLIMAAGRGTRMKNLAKDIPKPLLPVLGRPFLDYTIDRLHEAGFKNLIILIGHNGHAFSSYEHVSGIKLVEQHRFHERYGTAAAVENIKDLVGHQSFAVVAGDNLYSINDLQKVTIDSDRIRVGGYRTPAWQGLGILQQNDDGSLRQIIEKPSEFVGDLINASMYHFTPAIFTAIEKLQPSPRGEYEITDAINMIAAKELVEVVELEDRWLDLTSPADIGKIEQALPDIDRPGLDA